MNNQRGSLHWSHRYPERVKRGPAHPCAKLTPEQVEELRELSRTYGPSSLARYYGISRMTVWRYLKDVTSDVSYGTGG